MFLNLLKRVVFVFLNIPENPLKKAIREIFYGEVVSERIVEYSLVVSRLGYIGLKENRKVLGVGCFYSNFPIQLVSVGFVLE